MAKYLSQWDENALLFKTALEDKPNRASNTIVFPRILELFGDVSECNILDFGCGSGRFSIAFGNLGANIVGYDPSAKHVQLAQIASAEEFIMFTTKIEELSQDYFDFALCFQVLVCNPYQQASRICGNLYKFLRQGGRAAIVCTNTEFVGQTFPGGSTELPESFEAGQPYKRIFETSQGRFEVTDYWYSQEQLDELFTLNKFEILSQEIVADGFLLHFIEAKK